MGFGLSAYGTGPFGLDDVTGVTQESPALVSSRYISAIGLPVQRADGTASWVGMSDALQRALFLIKSSATTESKILGNYEITEQQRIGDALAPLTGGRNPVIEIVSVTVQDNGDDSAITRIRLRDLSNGGREETISARRSSY